MEEVMKENAILKRAVQVQHARIQERSSMEADVGALKTLVAQYQEQVHKLEMSNYALGLHLQKATTSGMGADYRPPDVY
jgi:hypothetical protein